MSSYTLQFPKLLLLDIQQENQYCLDWADFQALPDPDLDDLVKSLYFDIDATYLAEINRCVSQAKLEWDYRRSFDTVIRDMCLEPAKAYTQVVFGLIWDCVETTTTVDSLDDWWLQYAMLYKMWMGQTGSGVVRYSANLKRLEDWVANSSHYLASSKQKKGTKKFLQIIDDFESSRMKPIKLKRKKR